MTCQDCVTHCLKLTQDQTEIYVADYLNNYKIYILCCACMSLYAEALSWANNVLNIKNIVKHPSDADIIIVIGCQVTDLAILNDIRTLESLQYQYPLAQIFIGGCLAYRTDVKMPKNIKRIEHFRSDYDVIYDKSLVTYQAPFWVKDYNKSDHDAPYCHTSNGNIFRNLYPLRVSVGCTKNCAFCTINKTRGKPYELDTQSEQFINEFKYAHNNIVIIADNPSKKSILDVFNLASKFQKTISIRNIEPATLYETWPELIDFVSNTPNLLKQIHMPIQSNIKETLADMKRNSFLTMASIQLMRVLRERYNVYTATNIIIDYKHFPNPSHSLYETFNFISWNPYWDGIWNREKAEERYKHYIFNNFDPFKDDKSSFMKILDRFAQRDYPIE